MANFIAFKSEDGRPTFINAARVTHVTAAAAVGDKETSIVHFNSVHRLQVQGRASKTVSKLSEATE